MFPFRSHSVPAMSNPPDQPQDLLPASREDLVFSIQFMLMAGGTGRDRRRPARYVPDEERAAEARLMAERIADHLERSGYRVFKVPPAPPHSWPPAPSR